MAKHESHASSCNKCNFENKTECKLTDHEAKHRNQESSDDKSKTISCNKCNFETKSEAKLTNHVAKHITDDKSKTSTNIIGNLK